MTPEEWLAGVEADPLVKDLGRRVARAAVERCDVWPVVPHQSHIADVLERAERVGGGVGVTRQRLGNPEGWPALVKRQWFTSVSGGFVFTGGVNGG